MKSPKKILAIKLRALGDTVILLASLAELRRAYPEAEIHVAIPSHWAGLLESQPGITRVWQVPETRSRLNRAAVFAALGLKLRSQGFDLVLNFHASNSSALLSLATGASQRAVHFHGHFDQDRFSTLKIPGKGELKPIIERDLDVLRAIGLQPSRVFPRIAVQPAQTDRAKKFVGELGLSGPLLALGIGASRSTKIWPLSRFAQFAVRWATEKGGSALALAAPQEKELSQAFMKQVDELLHQSLPDAVMRSSIRARITAKNDIPLDTLPATLAQCALFVGNDSGPKHIAAAVGARTITLFGPEDPFEWHPYPNDEHPAIFVSGLPCRKSAAPGFPAWCGIDECIVENHRCMNEISVESVWSRIEKGDRS